VGSFRFEDRGRHKLKGLDGTHRLYAVQWRPEGASEERELAATAE
jgi:hypothetical protein